MFYIMKINFVDLKKNYENIKEEMLNEYQNLFTKCDFILGENVSIFENNFANYLGVKYFIGCANGTDALEIAIKCLDLTEMMKLLCKEILILQHV